jgi:putative oxidoreductase
MTTVALDRHDNVSTGALTRTATSVFATEKSTVLTILRIALGVVMVPHGLQKTLGWFGGYGFSGTLEGLGSMGIPLVLAFLVILAESAGALALIAGFTTRIAAFGIGAVMLGAATMHRANGFFMNWSGTQAGEGFEFHILALGIAAAVVIGGAGRLSIDRLIAKRIR